MSTLDAEVLEELRALAGPEALRETIALFVSGAEKNLAALRQELDDAKALSRTAHSLRGSCAVIGARRMAKLAAQLEELARAGGLEGVAELLERIESEYRATRAALEAEERRFSG